MRGLPPGHHQGAASQGRRAQGRLRASATWKTWGKLQAEGKDGGKRNAQQGRRPHRELHGVPARAPAHRRPIANQCHLLRLPRFARHQAGRSGGALRRTTSTCPTCAASATAMSWSCTRPRCTARNGPPATREAAICADCHSRHGVGTVHDDEGRVEVTESCGNCHQDSLETYLGTYHGKVTRLGYGETAKCYDCHGSHQIQRVDDPASQMHVDNRLETCQNCHEGATAGFVTFQPHGDRARPREISADVVCPVLHDRSAARHLRLLLVALGPVVLPRVEGPQGRQEPPARADRGPAANSPGKTHFRRFSRWWRLAHLVGAVSIMTLTLTGISVLYRRQFLGALHHAAAGRAGDGRLHSPGRPRSASSACSSST